MLPTRILAYRCEGSTEKPLEISEILLVPGCRFHRFLRGRAAVAEIQQGTEYIFRDRTQGRPRGFGGQYKSDQIVELVLQFQHHAFGGLFARCQAPW